MTQAILAFIEWGYRHAPIIDAAQAWVDAGALWPLAVSALWSFSWATVRSGQNRGSTVLRLSMYVPGIAFTILGFVHPAMHREAVAQWWGYGYELADSLLFSVALTWAGLSSVVIAVRVLVAFIRRESSTYRIHRAFLVAVLFMIVVAMADSVVAAFATGPVPSFSTVGTAIFVIVIGRAVSRYGMWEFAPQTAADRVLDTMGDAVVMVDREGTIRYANRATRSLLLLDGDPVETPARDLLPESLLSPEVLGKNLDESVSLRGNSVLRASVSVRAMPSIVGGRIIVLRDSEERIRYQEQLAHLAFHDALTGLGNREAFFEKLRDLCIWASRSRPGIAAAVLVDLDRFKEVNDMYGHGVGDEVLIDAAARLQESVRSTDSAFRLGGDEFALLLRDVSDAKFVASIVAKLLQAFSSPLQIHSLKLSVSVSFGYSVVYSEDTPEDVFARIDAGLYEAKKKRGTAVEFKRNEELPQTRRARIHRKVREAIPNGYLTWHYQPIVTASGAIVGGESLARWRDPDGEQLSPSEFIPAAEETGEIAAIGIASRRHAVELLKNIEDREIFLSVNISPREFAEDGFVERVLEQLNASDAVTRIHLELTETQLMELGPAQHRMFAAFADAGVRFMIDDFGTGYSSFTRLRDLPVHGVKLDRSFLVGADSDPRVRAVLDGAIQMVRGLGMVLIAEGVESRAQVDMLRKAGCTHFQGYYFFRPMAADRFLARMP
jgi:diguanylate cyclase (GGDEF)-like protein